MFEDNARPFLKERNLKELVRFFLVLVKMDFLCGRIEQIYPDLVVFSAWFLFKTLWI